MDFKLLATLALAVAVAGAVLLRRRGLLGNNDYEDLNRNRRMSGLMKRIDADKRKHSELASRIPVLQPNAYNEATRLERNIGREASAERLSPEMSDKVRSQLRTIALLIPRPRRA